MKSTAALVIILCALVWVLSVRPDSDRISEVTVEYVPTLQVEADRGIRAGALPRRDAGTDLAVIPR